MTQKQLQNKLYKEYNLVSEDFFKHQHYTILTRSGIEKIQAGSNIDVKFEGQHYEKDFVVIKAIATKGDKSIETFGSCTHGRGSAGNTISWYVSEIAEKRALARAILKIEGLYEHGAKSEDESDDWKDERAEITADVINRGNNAILRGEKTAEEVIEAVEAQYIVGESIKYNWKALKPQTKE